MVFNATFNSSSFISWRSVLLVEETGVLGENVIKLPVVKIFQVTTTPVENDNVVKKYFYN